MAGHKRSLGGARPPWPPRSDGTVENYKWVRNPFLPLDIHCIKDLKELIDIRTDGNIKLLHREMPLDEFWIKIQN